MLLHKSVEHDSRVRREARALGAAGHEVTVVHLPLKRHAEPFELDGFRVVCATPQQAWVRRLFPLRAYRVAFLAGFVRAALRSRPDVIHAHDAPMLAPGLLAVRLGRARLVYDSHELATGVPYRERFWGRWVARLERVAVPRCAAVITVSAGIAERLQELYALPTRPEVLRNLPDVETAVAGVGGLRERLGIGSAPLVLHQGALAPGRSCETLVQAVATLPEAHLVFVGDPWPGYDGVVDRTAREAGVRDRVHFLPSVPIRELLRHTREADVGVSLLSDDCENHRLALPNKVFEYIAAGVPVVVSDLPELRRVVEEHGVGWTTQAADVADLAATITVALREGPTKREALARAAAELHWSREAEKLLGVYDALGTRHNRPRAIVLVRNSVTYDARVLREGRLLRKMGFDTTIVGVTSTAEQRRDGSIEGVPVIRLAAGSVWRSTPSQAARSNHASRAGVSTPNSVRRDVKRALRRFVVTLDWYRRGIRYVRRVRPTLVHCNDYNTMWIGVAAKLGGARLVYDSHELWADRNLRPEPRPWLLLCEALFVRVADSVVTTSPSYARVIARRYRVPLPEVVRNIPAFEAPTERRRAADPVVLYFGAVTRNRGLEGAIEALAHLPGVRLRVVGPEAWGFRAELEELARMSRVEDRVELLGPVRPDRSPEVLASADVGLALIQPTCLSYRLTLPNKLFEYTRAELPIVATRLPEIERFVHEHGVGELVAPGDQAGLIATLGRVLDPAVNRGYREAAARAAKQLTWRSERTRLADVYGADLP